MPQAKSIRSNYGTPGCRINTHCDTNINNHQMRTPVNTQLALQIETVFNDMGKKLQSNK